MLIECPHCDARVHGKVLGEKSYFPSSAEDEFDPHKYIFIQCPSCHSPLLGCSMLESSGLNPDWESPERVWPSPIRGYEPSVPSLVSKSLEEAQRCFQASAYLACAVMCGRAIEAICTEKTGKSNLASGLKQMREDNAIDQRLYNWGEALRKERNVGAHANHASGNRQDAKDLLDFAWAFVDYVFVLSEKFDAYERRKNSQQQRG